MIPCITKFLLLRSVQQVVCISPSPGHLRLAAPTCAPAPTLAHARPRVRARARTRTRFARAQLALRELCASSARASRALHSSCAR
eukprot:1441558-Karenia_brevis.AAC.1